MNEIGILVVQYPLNFNVIITIVKLRFLGFYHRNQNLGPSKPLFNSV